MVEARTNKPITFLVTEFNNFLFASIGADGLGDQLSVVSALARLDLDPWEEAAKLSYLSRDSASHKLSLWMSRFPELAAGFEERNQTARRLVALLPQRVLGKTNPMRRKAFSRDAVAGRAIAPLLIIALCLLFAGQIFLDLRIATPHPPFHAARPALVSAPLAMRPGS